MSYLHSDECVSQHSVSYSGTESSLRTHGCVFRFMSKGDVLPGTSTDSGTENFTGARSQQVKTNGTYQIVQLEEFKFSKLVQRWHAERGATSSVSDMIICPSYLGIIGMGARALPLIFSQIQREGDDPDHWFVALKAITGEDPVSEDAYGDTVRMAEEWLSWAKENHDW